MILQKIGAALQRILGWIIALMTAAMMLILAWQVFVRYVLRDSSGWTSEMATLLFVWCSMLGAAYAVRAGGHVAMTMLISKFKGKAGVVVALIDMLLCEGFFFVLLSGGASMMEKLSKATTAQLKIPMPIVYSAFVVAGIFMMFFGLEWIVGYIQKLAKPTEENNELKGGEA